MTDTRIPINEQEWTHCPACVRAPVVQRVTVQAPGLEGRTVYLASCWGDTAKRGEEQFPSHAFTVRGLTLEEVRALWNNR